MLCALAGCAGRSLRTQADADPRDCAGDPDVAAGRVRTQRHRPVRRPARRRLRRGHGVSDDAGVDRRPLVRAGAHEVDRAVVRARRRDRFARPAVLRLPAGALLLGIGVPDHAASGGGGDSHGLVARARARQRVDRAGGQPRRHPLARPRRSADPVDQLRARPQPGDVDDRPRADRVFRARLLLLPAAPGAEPALRPARSRRGPRSGSPPARASSSSAR